ncbi:MAG: prepilin-type N-terminal cleavage/methylation domain-containing protein [Candidatus Pacebacteria bacterium]|nr:prepilin-type N-terminal cleavage/methylation domain-containing protein [Candidatus Paceibacterota bacterium]
MKHKKQQSGFTLVEVMVSLMIFTIVVLAAVGSLYTVNSASRKVQAMRSVLDNLTFAIESMSRTVRTANSVVCGGSFNTSGNPNCIFSDQGQNSYLLVASTLGTEQLVEYRLGFHSNGKGAVQKRLQESGVWSNWISLTAPEIDIKKLLFYVDGASSSDDIQTSVQMFISGEASANNVVSPFAVQTYISERASE